MRFTVTVKPNAPATKVEERGQQLTVWLKVPPFENRANIELIKVLARHWQISRKDIMIVQGVKSRVKIVEVAPSNSFT